MNSRVIKNKIVFTHIYNICFQDSLLRSFFIINEKKREIINIIREYFIIVNNTHYNNRMFKFENLCVFNKRLRYKFFFFLYLLKQSSRACFVA